MHDIMPNSPVITIETSINAISTASIHKPSCQAKAATNPNTIEAANSKPNKARYPTVNRSHVSCSTENHKSLIFCRISRSRSVIFVSFLICVF